MKLEAKLKFCKAGQGCFYTGNFWLTKPKKNFYFAYDCGTLSPRQYIGREIENFKDSLHAENDSILDMLVISHLDADHINQISDLLHGIRCRLVVMPYLSPIERLMLYFTTRGDEQIGPNPEYFEFISDPVKYLLDKNGVDEVILIRGNGEGFQGNSADVTPPKEPTGNPNDQFEISDDNLPDMNEDEIGKFSELKNIVSTHKAKVKLKKGDGTLQFNSTGPVRYTKRYFWEFYFWNKEQDDATTKKFISEINKSLKLKLADSIDALQLKQIFKNEKKLSSFKKIFRKNFKDFNSTGIVLLHSPIHFNACTFILYAYPNFRRNYIPYWIWNAFVDDGLNTSHYSSNNSGGINSFSGTLLNGDINLKEHGFQYPQYIRNRMREVELFQVPHHGSKHNWESSQLQNLNVRTTTMTINFGYGNKFGHPGSAVIDEILRKGNWILRFAHQFSQTEYKYNLEY